MKLISYFWKTIGLFLFSLFLFPQTASAVNDPRIALPELIRMNAAMLESEMRSYVRVEPQFWGGSFQPFFLNLAMYYPAPPSWDWERASRDVIQSIRRFGNIPQARADLVRKTLITRPYRVLHDEALALMESAYHAVAYSNFNAHFAFQQRFAQFDYQVYRNIHRHLALFLESLDQIHFSGPVAYRIPVARIGHLRNRIAIITGYFAELRDQMHRLRHLVRGNNAWLPTAHNTQFCFECTHGFTAYQVNNNLGNYLAGLAGQFPRVTHQNNAQNNFGFTANHQYESLQNFFGVQGGRPIARPQIGNGNQPKGVAHPNQGNPFNGNAGFQGWPQGGIADPGALGTQGYPQPPQAPIAPPVPQGTVPRAPVQQPQGNVGGTLPTTNTAPRGRQGRVPVRPGFRGTPVPGRGGRFTGRPPVGSSLGQTPAPTIRQQQPGRGPVDPRVGQQQRTPRTGQQQRTPAVPAAPGGTI